MSCIKIAVRDPQEVPDEFYSTDGYVYFDLPDNFDLRQTKRINELSELNELRLDYIYGFNLPATLRNRNLLQTFTHAGILDNDILPINVIIMEGTTYNSEAELYVRSYTKKGYVADLNLSSKHWARLLQLVFLKDLSYEDFEHTCANVKDVNAVEYPYEFNTQFNTSGLCFPLVNYGQLLRDREGAARALNYIQPLEFWRPWFYVSGILQRAFCAINWTFKSPILESPYGRKLICYMMRKDYGADDQSLINQLSAEARANSTYFVNLPAVNSGTRGIIKFKDVIEDPLGSFHTNGAYRGVGEVGVKGLLKFRVPVSKEPVIMRLVKLDRDYDLTAIYTGPPERPYPQQTFEYTDVDDIKEFEFEVDSLSVSSVQELAVIAIAQKPFINGAQVITIEVQSSSYFRVQGLRRYTPQSYNPADLFHKSLNSFDYLKAVTKLLNGKIKTDAGKREITLYTPYDADVFDFDVEGFYKEQDIEDITYQIDLDSVKTVTPSLDLARYVNFGFKKSTDDSIKGLSLEQELWSVTEDLGEKYLNLNTDPELNPLFEPTLNTINQSSRINTFIHIPKIIGKSEITFDIEPRILVNFGNVVQEHNRAEPTTIRYCDYTNLATPLIPTASHFVPIEIGVHNETAGATERPKENLVFNVPLEISEIGVERSIHKLFHYRDLVQNRQNIGLEYLGEISKRFFKELDFRTLYGFRHMGRFTSLTMQEARDFHACNKLTTPMKFLPTVHVTDICDLIPDNNFDPSLPCSNFPIIECVYVGDCYVFSIGGENSEIIDQVDFSYRLESGGGFISLPNVTTISSQLCNISEPFFVKATVSYDDAANCEDIDLPEKYVTPCPELEYELNCISYVISGGRPGSPSVAALRFEVVMPSPEDIDIELLSSRVGATGGFVMTGYNMVRDGERFVGDEIIIEGDYTFEVDFQYKDCPPVTLSKDCVLLSGGGGGESPLPCDQIDFQLICSEVIGTGCFEFVRDGIFPYEIDDHIKYRVSYDGGLTFPEGWLLWDNITPVCGPYVEAKWLVQTCDDLCPFRCSETIVCQETTCPDITAEITCDVQDLSSLIGNPSMADLTGITYDWHYSVDNTTFATTGITTEHYGTAAIGFYKLFVMVPGCPTIESAVFDLSKPNSGTQNANTVLQ